MAAGKGTRLNCTDRPKVMLEIGGRPIVSYVVETLEAIGFSPEQICVVVGFNQEKVRDYFNKRVRYVEQKEQLGTAHAADLGMRGLAPHIETVLVMGGDDSAFYTPATLTNFIRQHIEAQATVSLLTAVVNDPTLLGRVIRDTAGNFIQVLEKEEIVPAQAHINEVSTGTYCFNRHWFEENFSKLPAIGTLGEYGLPKTVELARSQGRTVQAVALQNSEEWFGVNTPEELAEADRRKKLTLTA